MTPLLSHPTRAVPRAGMVLALGLSACTGGQTTKLTEPSPTSVSDMAGTEPPGADHVSVAGLEVLDDGDPALPVNVIDATGTEVTVTSTQRIIPANGDLAEVVFALGMGEKVVARDISATFPPEVEALPSVGYQRTLPLEPVAAFEPTLVLATTEAGPAETVSGLRDLGIPVVVVNPPDDLAGPPEKVRAVAAVLGVTAEDGGLASRIEEEISAATTLAGQLAIPPGWRRCTSGVSRCSFCSGPAARRASCSTPPGRTTSAPTSGPTTPSPST